MIFSKKILEVAQMATTIQIRVDEDLKEKSVALCIE